MFNPEKIQISPVIDQSYSTDQVVNAINAASAGEPVAYFGGTDHHSAEHLAAHYAINAQIDSGSQMSLDAISVHLDCVADFGAEFDMSTAFKIAAKMLEEAGYCNHV